MRYALIEAEKATHSVDALCRALGGSRAAYYAWKTRKPTARGRANEALLEKVRQAHRRSRKTYGSRRVHAALRSARANSAVGIEWRA